jgi:recombination protein RecA
LTLRTYVRIIGAPGDLDQSRHFDGIEIVAKRSRKRKLDALVASLQRRYGQQALRQVRKPVDEPQIAHIATGFPPLDQALGIGGLPRGRVTECIGAYTSGKTTIVLKTMAESTAAGDVVAFIDLERTFNPDYAVRAGVDLSRVILPPAADPLQALEVIHHLIAAEAGIGLVVFNDVANLMGQDHAAAWLSATLRQITSALHQSQCAVVFLTTPLRARVSAQDYPSGFALAHYAALRLEFRKTATLRRRDGTRGFRVEVKVLKNKLAAPASKPVSLDIYFNGAVESNGII